MITTLTVTLKTSLGVPLPAEFGPFAGFRVSITSPSGTKAAPPVERKVVWTMTGFDPGATYKLLVEAVDEMGRTIQALPEASIVVPTERTYERLDGFELAWS